MLLLIKILLLPNLQMGMEPPCFIHVLLCGKPLNLLINPHGGFIELMLILHQFSPSTGESVPFLTETYIITNLHIFAFKLLPKLK